MSRNKQKRIVNRVELKVLIVRYYGTNKAFCAAFHINYETFKGYMAGVESMPKLNAKIIQIMESYKIDPYTPDEYPMIEPAVMVKIMGNMDKNK